MIKPRTRLAGSMKTAFYYGVSMALDTLAGELQKMRDSGEINDKAHLALLQWCQEEVEDGVVEEGPESVEEYKRLLEKEKAKARNKGEQQ